MVNEIAFPSKANPPRTCVLSYARMTQWPWPWPNDLDTWPWLDVLNTYMSTKNEISRSRISTARARTDRYTSETVFSAYCTSPYSRLWNKLPPILFVFLISLVYHHHPALLYRQALILNRFSWRFSLSSSQSLSLHSHLSLTRAVLLEFDHSVFDSHRRLVWRW